MCKVMKFIYIVRKTHTHMWALFRGRGPGKEERDFHTLLALGPHGERERELLFTRLLMSLEREVVTWCPPPTSWGRGLSD